MERLPRFLSHLTDIYLSTIFRERRIAARIPGGALPTSGSAPLLLMTYNKTIGRDDMLVV